MLPDSRKLKVMLLVAIIAVALIAGAGFWRFGGLRAKGALQPLTRYTTIA